jgi:hypothetical protein
MKKLLFAFFVLLLGRTAEAQVEAAHLFSKGSSVTGFGIFLHMGVAVSKGDEISAEFAFYYFQPKQYHMAPGPDPAGPSA